MGSDPDPDGSSLGTPPIAQMLTRLIGQPVPSTGGNVFFQLVIPLGRIEFHEPGAELVPLVWGVAADGIFNLMYVTHNEKNTPATG